MKKLTALAIILLISFAINVPAGFCKQKDPKTEEKESYERKKEFKSNIRKGDTKQEVVAILGDPESIETPDNKSSKEEIWFYDGKDVMITFKNDKVSKYFLRFMPDKEVKEKEKDNKCDLCEKDKKKKQ